MNRRRLWLSGRPCGGARAAFSLPELLIAVVVLGILAAMAVPSGQGALARMRVEAASRSLMLEIERGRDRALRDGRPLLLALEGEAGLLAEVEATDAALEVHHNLPEALRFTANGLLIDGGTVVVASPATPLRRCLVLALPLGVLRLGQYASEPAAGLSSEHCRPDPTL
jgi:prepilin-type N-terminal cleavage/methylation domain-containing protein